MVKAIAFTDKPCRGASDAKLTRYAERLSAGVSFRTPSDIPFRESFRANPLGRREASPKG